MEYTIVDEFFKVWYSKDGFCHVLPLSSESLSVEVGPNEALRFGLLLPAYLFENELWAAVGRCVDGTLVGFDKTSSIIRPCPPPSASEAMLPRCRELCFTSLLASAGGYDLVLLPLTQALSKTEGRLYYNIVLRDRDDGGELPLEFTVGSHERPSIDLDDAFDDYAGGMPSVLLDDTYGWI